jgi:hypothetical protein
MGVIKTIGKNGIIAAAMAKLQKERVEEATLALKTLYDRERKAKKVLQNVRREIEDYLQELEIDDGDVNADPS